MTQDTQTPQQPQYKLNLRTLRGYEEPIDVQEYKHGDETLDLNETEDRLNAQQQRIVALTESREEWRRIAEGSDSYVRTVTDKLRNRVVVLEAALRKATIRFRQQACGCSVSHHLTGCKYHENPTAFKAGPTLHLVGCTKIRCHPECPHWPLISPSEAK